MSTSETISLYSLLIALIALVLSLVVALYTVWRADKTASAGMLITLHDGLRDSWQRFLNSAEDKRSYEFAELVNLMEISCALYLNRSLTAKPRELMKDYLVSCFTLLANNQDARLRLQALAQDPSTFSEIRAFELKYRSTLSLFNPLFTP